MVASLSSPRVPRALWFAIPVVVLAAILARAAPTLGAVPAVGSANKAKLLCSAVLAAGRSPEEVAAAEVGAPLVAPVAVELDREEALVRGSLLWARETVVHRPGLGCTRAVGTDPEALRRQVPPGTVPPAPDLSGLPWPTGDRIDPTALPPLDRAALDAAVARAFAEPDPAEPVRHTRAVAVVWRGALVAERYAEGFDATTPLLGWSMTKSLTNALVGLRVGDGALDLHAPAPVPEWRAPDDPRGAITPDQLLRMSSGLAFGEVYDDLSSDAVTMLFGDGGQDMGAYAAAKPLAASPDTRWSYSSGTTNLIQRMLRGTFPDHAAYLRYPHERLFHRIGMTRSWIEPDASGTYVGSSFGYGTARDWARFGLLFLNDGVWEGERLLPEGWVRYSTTPTPAAPEGRYGAHWWLNAGEPDAPEQRPWPRLPPDAYRASGFEGQSVMIVPSRELVVVRLGWTVDEAAFRIDDFVAELIGVLEAGPTG